MQKQASSFQQAVQGPLKSLGQRAGEVGSGLQRNIGDVLDRTTQPMNQVSPLSICNVHWNFQEWHASRSGCEMSADVGSFRFEAVQLVIFSWSIPNADD